MNPQQGQQYGPILAIYWWGVSPLPVLVESPRYEASINWNRMVGMLQGIWCNFGGAFLRDILWREHTLTNILYWVMFWCDWATHAPNIDQWGYIILLNRGVTTQGIGNRACMPMSPIQLQQVCCVQGIKPLFFFDLGISATEGGKTKVGISANYWGRKKKLTNGDAQVASSCGRSLFDLS